MPAYFGDDAFIEQLARAVHEHYVSKRRARGETETTNLSMVSWDRLPEVLRQAGVVRAANIVVDLGTINAGVVPESAGAPEFRFRDREVEDLAELEHKRWRSERIADRWVGGNMRTNKSESHPDLVDWPVLPESQQEKDRDSIRAIPGILHDMGYQILRLRRPGTTEEAIPTHQEAAAIFRETGDQHREGMAMNNLGLALQEVGQFEEAITAHQEAATVYRKTGDRRGEDKALTNLELARTKRNRETGRWRLFGHKHRPHTTRLRLPPVPKPASAAMQLVHTEEVTHQAAWGTSGAHGREICSEAMRTAKISIAGQHPRHGHMPWSARGLHWTRPTGRLTRRPVIRP